MLALCSQEEPSGAAAARRALERLVMAEPQVERRIAAILAADMVGFSRLMAQDEEATLAALNACRAVIEKLVPPSRPRVRQRRRQRGRGVRKRRRGGPGGARDPGGDRRDQRRAAAPEMGPVSDRRQPRRRHGRPGQPARRRRQRRRPPRSPGRARRPLDLGQRLRSGRGQVRPGVRVHRPADPAQLRALDPRLPLAPGQ
jgi:hypothetical protein